MKKLIAILMLIVLMLSMTSCGTVEGALDIAPAIKE